MDDQNQRSKPEEMSLEDIARVLAPAIGIIARVLAPAIAAELRRAPGPAADRPLVGGKALAEALDVSDETVGRLARSGRIPFVEVAGRRRFDVAAVRAALAGAAKTASQPRAPIAGVVHLSRPRRVGGGAR